MTNINFSTVESPVAKAWRTFNKMTRKGVAPARKNAIAAAIKVGVSPGTAAVQYHKWLADAKAAASQG